MKLIRASSTDYKLYRIEKTDPPRRYVYEIHGPNGYYRGEGEAMRSMDDLDKEAPPPPTGTASASSIAFSARVDSPIHAILKCNDAHRFKYLKVLATPGQPSQVAHRDRNRSRPSPQRRSAVTRATSVSISISTI